MFFSVYFIFIIKLLLKNSKKKNKQTNYPCILDERKLSINKEKIPKPKPPNIAGLMPALKP